MSQGCNPVMCQNESETQKELRSIIAGMDAYIRTLTHVGSAGIAVFPDYEAIVGFSRTHSGAVQVQVK